MNNELKFVCRALNSSLKDTKLVRDFIKIKDIVFKKDWVKKIIENKEIDPKLNDFSKTAMEYEKMKLAGKEDIEVENMLSLWGDIVNELEEIKREIVVWFIAF